MKSPNMISRIGRQPRRAMPAATPKIAPSETGVVITRCGHFVERPCVTLNAPPYGSRTSSPSEIDVVAALEGLGQRRVDDRGAALFHVSPPRASATGEASALAIASVSRRSTASSMDVLLLVRQPRAGDAERIALARRLDLGRVAVVVALRVRAVAVRVEDEEERSRGRPHLGHDLFRGVPDLAHVGRVQLRRLDPERGSAVGDPPGQRQMAGSGLRVEVVLDDDQQRQAPARRDVEALVDDALPQRPVADEGDSHRAAAPLALGERHPRRDRHRAPEHAVRVEAVVAEVLAPALAAADAALPAHHLAQQPVHVVCEREVVAVAAVVGDDHVAPGLEVVDHADGVRLLADVRVRRARELAQREELEQALFEAADENHPLVQAGELRHRLIFAQRLGFACHDSRDGTRPIDSPDRTGAARRAPAPPR